MPRLPVSIPAPGGACRRLQPVPLFLLPHPVHRHDPGSAAEALDYSRYYHEGNLAVPPFVERRLGEVVGDFEKYRRATCGSTLVVARVL